MRARIAGSLAAAVLAACPGKAHALLCGTFLNPLTITATDINFGAYSAGTVAAATASGTVKLKCTLALDLLPNFVVSISAGTSGSFATRQMAQGADRLNYNLYTDGAYSAVWGDGSGGSVTQSYSSGLLLNDQTFTAFGRLPANQYVRAGAYSDSLIVTVSY